MLPIKLCVYLDLCHCVAAAAVIGWQPAIGAGNYYYIIIYIFLLNNYVTF